jgi:hypothetical protein
MLQENANLDMYWDNIVKDTIQQETSKRKLEYALSHNKRIAVSHISHIILLTNAEKNMFIREHHQIRTVGSQQSKY